MTTNKDFQQFQKFLADQKQHQIDERLERPIADLITHAKLVSMQISALRSRICELNANEPLIVPKQFKTFYECNNCHEKMERFDHHKCFSEFEGRN